MGQTVYAAANPPKRLWTAPLAGHNDLAAHGAIEEAIAFVRERAWMGQVITGAT